MQDTERLMEIMEFLEVERHEGDLLLSKSKRESAALLTLLKSLKKSQRSIIVVDQEFWYQSEEAHS